jgi:thiopurine S-methyltransferase
MEPDFWLKKWQDNQIFFHEGNPNTLLTGQFAALEPRPGAEIFVPLCGKTQDLHWLAAQGFRVTGAELSGLAVEQFYAEASVTPKVTETGRLRRFEGQGITIFLGDVFDLDQQMLGPIDAIYDRAALVALPFALRSKYAAHLIALTKAAPQFVVTFEYDQSLQAGPPFSIPEAELRALYGAAYSLRQLATRDVPGGLRGVCPAQENAWLLR